MRLFEISPTRMNGPENNLIALLGYLKSKGDQRAAGIKVPMSSVIALMQNTGQNVSYTDIEALRQNNTAIQNLIKSVNKDEIILNTNTDDEMASSGEDNFLPGDEMDVEQMAKRAASRRAK
jgi:type II secretory pathway component PulC